MRRATQTPRTTKASVLTRTSHAIAPRSVARSATPRSTDTAGPGALNPATQPARHSSTSWTHLVVLIPAYQPDSRLPELTATLRRRLACTVLVVDDGSGPAWDATFQQTEASGGVVLRYPDNAGKGHALRTGLGYAAATWPEADVVCADADGQHTPEDVAAVAARVRRTRHLTLGVREFTGQVPARSRLGNQATATLFRAATGWALTDTQTGLRGYPAGRYLWALAVPGNRYEYELAALLAASARGEVVEQVRIETVYEPGNPTSHFRPLRDSAAIYRPLLGALARRGVRALRDLAGDSHHGPQPVREPVRAVRQAVRRDRARRLPPRLAG